MERLHKIHYIERKSLQRIDVIRGRLTKVQTSVRPDHVCPEVWTQIGKAAQNREEPEWKNENPKLDSARRLTGTYSVDPDDQDYKETLKKRGENWKDIWQQLCLAKRKAQTSTTKVAAEVIACQKVPKIICGCTVEFHESTRRRVEPSQPAKHEDHIAGRGFTSMTHYKLVHKVFSYASSDENPRCGSCGGQGMEEVRDNPSVANGKVKSKKGLFSMHKETKKESPIATLMETCHLKTRSKNPNYRIQRQSRAPW